MELELCIPRKSGFGLSKFDESYSKWGDECLHTSDVPYHAFLLLGDVAPMLIYKFSIQPLCYSGTLV